MKYINAHIPQHLLFFLILLPAWTHEGRRGVFERGKKKKESPWGFPERERKENGKERGWECGEEGECIRPRQAEPKTRKRRNEY